MLEINKGYNKENGLYYGLFAGKIEQGATVSQVSVTGKMTFYAEALNGSLTKDNGTYTVGLVAGVGYEFCQIDYSGITLEAVNGDGATHTVTLGASGNVVSWFREKKQ
ncbi:MAG: hypothetical protein IKL79_06015 [Clostridia bacterium]|nr:hypothetical protein [Clostridia bacterium]